MTLSCREQVRLFLSFRVWGTRRRSCQWHLRSGAAIICFLAQPHNSHAHYFILQATCRAGARCCHGFLKTWPQPSSSTLVWRPRAGAGFKLRCVRAVSTQVASWLQAPVVWENDGVSSACISDACTSATSIFSCLPGFCLPSTCLLFPLLMSQSLPVIKSAGIHRRGSIIFWQEDGNRTIPRSN